MKDKMITKWNSIKRKYKLVTLLLAQIWFWPQLFSSDMPPNIGLPLGVTMIGCLMYNLILWVHACEYDQ